MFGFRIGKEPTVKAMKLLYWAVFLLVQISSITCDNFRWQKFKEVIAGLQEYDEQLQHLNTHEQISSQSIKDTPFIPDFPCPKSTSSKKPMSVHQLRPGDIDVVAALGDSLTAGNGACADTLIGAFTEFRGVVFSIGGDDDITSVKSLANVFKYYNPSLYGYSTGTGNEHRPNAKFDVAVVGAISEDIASQAVDLVQRMKQDPNVDFYNDWKVITLFIGSNDQCGWCDNEDRFTAEKYVANVQQALDILHSDVPRALVNVVGVLDVTQMAVLKGIVCSVVHLAMCSCAVYGERTETLSKLSHQYQELIEKLILSGRYDTTDDFTVVLQPFLQRANIPVDKEGNGDLSFFSPDCFHFSQKGHAAGSVGLWNNMIQPVGSKMDYWIPGEHYTCPSVIFPYLYTNLNSEPDWVPVFDDPLENFLSDSDDDKTNGMTGMHITIAVMLSIIGFILLLLVIFMRVKIQRVQYRDI